MSIKKYKIKGMHCASCAAIISKELSGLEGVKKVDVNFATEKMTMEADRENISVEAINNRIGKLGYSVNKDQSAAEMGMTESEHAAHLGIGQSKEDKLKELSAQRSKALFAFPSALIVFALMLLDIMMKFFPSMPKLIIPMELLNFVLMTLATIMVFWVGAPFLRGVARFMKYRVANMDTLIGIGTLTAYVYSAVIMLLPSVKIFFNLPEYLYFDVVIVVIGFVIFGKYLEAKSKLKTGEAIEKLLGLQAKSAIIFKDGKELEIPIGEVKSGDVVIVKPGTKIPVDGVILEGGSSVDESMVTGESIPVDKKANDLVIGGTINKQGAFKMGATKVGSDTVLAQIIKMVEDAQGSKAPIQEMADKISAVFVPVVLVIAFMSLITWLIAGYYFLGFSVAASYAIMAFVGVLVIACPCALGLATPTAIIVGVGKGAEYGILIKNAESLETLSSVDTVVFDKTGTITKGSPELTDILILDSEFSENKILQLAASVEKLSEHPLAQAIVGAARKNNIELSEPLKFEALEGVGIKAVVGGVEVQVSKPENKTGIQQIKNLQSQGKTVVLVKLSGKNIGIIALSDTIKDSAIEAIAKLHGNKINVIMLTGDNLSAAKYIAKQAGIDEVIAEVLPQEKAQKIKELQKNGKRVAMVGDGINDAPALAQAEVGIAMATGTDVAIESAGITLLKGDLKKVSQAIELARSTMRIIKQNLFWAFIYNIVGIPLAAGLFYPIFGIFLNPIFAGLAMAGSSVSVVSNSLRLKVSKLK